MNVEGIVKKYLKKNGYEGLTDRDDCGCSIHDLASCGNDCMGCVPAYEFRCCNCSKRDEDGDCDVFISSWDLIYSTDRAYCEPDYQEALK